MTRPVLVTGATGLIGPYVVRRLLEIGMPLRVLVRDPARLAPELRGRVGTITGDMRDPDALRRAVAGTSAVVNLAAVAAAWSPRPQEFREVNVEAVRALLAAARDAGVGRMVHVSTVLTLPEIRARRHPARAVTPYEATKLAGEDLVAAAAAEGFPAVIVHPTRVFGPGPLNDANGVTRLLALYLRGPVTLRLADQDVRANYVHAADVAQGIARALTRGVPGAHYVLGGTELSVRELLDLAGNVAGHRHPVLAVPPRAAVVLARASCLWGRLGGRALITPDWVWSYLEDHAIDLAPTIAALGYHPLPFRERLRETIQWLRHSSLIAA